MFEFFALAVLILVASTARLVWAFGLAGQEWLH